MEDICEQIESESSTDHMLIDLNLTEASPMSKLTNTYPNDRGCAEIRGAEQTGEGASNNRFGMNLKTLSELWGIGDEAGTSSSARVTVKERE